MTDQGYRHFTIILDRSGSMAKIKAGMQSGFEEFITHQAKEPGRATISLWDFNTEIRCVADFTSLDDPAIVSYQLVPRGNTAMYDAIGQAVTREGEKLAALPESQRPHLVVVLIISDGEENSSIEYNLSDGGGERIAAMLTHQQEAYAWNVVYMGTNQDAFKEGGKVGVHSGSTLSYDNTNEGSRGAWSATSSAISRAVSAASAGLPADIMYNAAERKMAVKKEDSEGK